MMSDHRALFDAGEALGFPRLPIRPAVSVLAGREAWERFTTNGTAEDLAAARLAVAAALAEKAPRGDGRAADAGAGQPERGAPHVISGAAPLRAVALAIPEDRPS